MGENLVRALDGVTLEIEDGDFVAIMGPSGSGKSTLAHIIGLLDVPTSGIYKLNNNEVSGLSADELALLRREEIGFIFQQFNLLPRMTALENVGLPTLYSTKSKFNERSKILLGRVGLGSREHHHPNELSGGQQQRVAIARALVNQPRMIIADEPTGNLDSASEKEIMAILKELNSQGITIVMVTHEEEIGNQAKRLIRMRDGRIQSDLRTGETVSNNKGGESSKFHSKGKKETHPSNLIANGKEFLEHFRQGFKTLAANKIRTALSMLGILIGVAAVVAMLALGKGAQKSIETQLASLGSNLLVLRAGAARVGGIAHDAGATSRLTYDDGAAIQEQIPVIRAVGPTVNGRGQITYSNKNWSTSILGVSPSYVTMRASAPILGRFFDEEENKKRARVAVIGTTLVRELFGGLNPVGETLKINKVSFQVIGVLPEKGANGWRDQDDVITVPILTAMHRLLGKIYVDSIDLEVKDARSVDFAEKEVLDLIYSKKKVALSQQSDAFSIRNMAEIQAALSESSRTMAALLASIAAISLLVGGVGIMNIMLVSVTERTKEIGLRKAIGAKRRDILLQFISESVVVSAVGGIAGIILGVAITLTLSAITGWATSVSIESVLLAFFFSATIGMIFGIYPAKKASELHPIDALRFE